MLVNFLPAHLDQKLYTGDLLTNIHHQHEHPVLDWPIQVIYEDDVRFYLSRTFYIKTCVIPSRTFWW